MPKIYVKSTTLGDERCIILNPREGLIYPLQFKDWRRVKVAMYFSIVPNLGNDNQSATGLTAEAINIYDVRDRFLLGLKSTNNLAMPGEDGEYFWGLMSGPTNSEVTPNSSRLTNIGPGSIYPNSSNLIQNVNPSVAMNGSATSNFGSYLGVEMNLYGVTTSNVTIKPGDVPLEFLYRTTSSSITNVSKEALRLDTLGSAFSMVATKDMAPEGSARPQALFLYWPFFNYKLRVHSIGAFQTG